MSGEANKLCKDKSITKDVGNPLRRGSSKVCKCANHHLQKTIVGYFSGINQCSFPDHLEQGCLWKTNRRAQKTMNNSAARARGLDLLSQYSFLDIHIMEGKPMGVR